MSNEYRVNGGGEKRKHPRFSTSNSIQYVLFDESRNELERGDGRTLDLSRGGVLLETPHPLRGSLVLLTILDMKGKTIEVEGRVANSRKPEHADFYLTGVEFTDSDDEPINAAIAFIKAFNSGLKVMIIDDDPTTRSFLDRILRKQGFQIRQAQDGKEALEQLRITQPDLIISDIIMPELDGFKLFTALRESKETEEIPFIFLSVKSDPVDQLKGLRMGADEYLVKPFVAADILEAVDKVMKKTERMKGLKNDVDIVGNLSQISLIDVIQMIEFNEKSGELFLLSPTSDVTGAVYIREGQIVNAVSGSLDGEEAFYDLAAQKDGFFKFYIREAVVGDKIGQENMTLLMEASRLADEAGSLDSRLSAMNNPLVLSTPDMPDDVGERVSAEDLVRVLDLVRSGKSAAEIIAGANMSRPRAASVLADLIHCGVVAEQQTTSPEDTP